MLVNYDFGREFLIFHLKLAHFTIAVVSLLQSSYYYYFFFKFTNGTLAILLHRIFTFYDP